MSKKYYVKRWYTLDNYYDKLCDINKQLEKEPNNKKLIEKKLILLRKIKHFLRYEANKEDYRS